MSVEHYYAIVAKRKDATEMRFFHSFGFSPNPDSAFDKIHKRYVLDPMFRQKWKGWVFAVMLADHLLEIDGNGAMLLYKNERQPLGG